MTRKEAVMHHRTFTAHILILTSVAPAEAIFDRLAGQSGTGTSAGSDSS